MKYLKLFEELDIEDENASKIKEIWGIDPYVLNEIILSSCSEISIWGELKINFLIITTNGEDDDVYLNNYDEYTDVEFQMKNGELETGSNYEYMQKLIDEYDYTPAIEAFILIGDKKKFEKRGKLVKLIKSMMRESKSTYHLTHDEDKEDSIYLHFNKIVKKSEDGIRYI